MRERGLGSHIYVYTGTLASADDIILTSETKLQMMVQVGVFADLNNRDRLKIHPQKTSVNLFNYPEAEAKLLRYEMPWKINGCPVSVTDSFVYLGV